MQASKDALALATHADAVLFVAALGEISVAQVTSAMQQMRRARVKVIGTVVTGAGS
jgi:Mrp family chromosome partitioning ATPase